MIYCFICDECGNTIEKPLPMTKAKHRPRCACKAKMRRNLQAEQGAVIDTPGAWPMASDAAGVHPAQVPEAMAYFAKKGVPTRFDSNGNPEFTSRNHRKRFCAAGGFYDRNGGYGDASPKNNMQSSKERRSKLRDRIMKNAGY